MNRRRRSALSSVSTAVEDCRYQGIERQWRLAGQTIHLTLGDMTIADPFMRGLEHLPPAAGTEPDLRISVLTRTVLDLWEMVHAAFAEDFQAVSHRTAANPLVFYQDDRFCLECQPARHRFSLLDRANAEAVVWLPDVSQVTMRDRANPLRAVLYWWLRTRNRQMVHAAAVGTEHGGVLITGKSGSGKSTTALACVQGGFGYLGDDHVLLEHGDTPHVHNIYGSAAVHHTDLRAHFMSLGLARSDDPSDPKSLVYLRAHQLIDSVPLRAVLVPVIGDGVGHPIDPILPGAALASLAPSSIMQLPGAGPNDFRQIARTIAAIPSFRLYLPAALSTIPAIIADLLAQLADRP